MKSIPIIVFIAIVALCAQIAWGQSVYEYPIRPGTKEWKNLKNHSEKVMACQLPSEVLKTLSTMQLLDACLEYPLLGDIMAFNNTQHGVDAFKMNFNGIEEFLRRSDRHKVLIDRYANADPAGYKNDWSDINKGEYAYRILVLELIIAQHELLNLLDSSQRRNLVGLLLEVKKQKAQHEIYSYHSIMSIYYPIARILMKENVGDHYLDKEVLASLTQFSMNGNLRELHLIPTLDILAVDYIKNRKP